MLPACNACCVLVRQWASRYDLGQNEHVKNVAENHFGSTVEMPSLDHSGRRDQEMQVGAAVG